MSAEHPDNPSDPKEYDSLKDSGARYAILGTAVGAHLQGDVVSARDLGRGASIDRLIGLGAIAPLGDEEAKAHREKAGGLPASAAADARRLDPRFSTGSTAPAIDPKVLADTSGPVRDDKPAAAPKGSVFNPPK